ncbi:MAG: ABC transporter permease subunit [Syntrophobacterales bacterium]|jgi:ABC-type transport system involved in multi-copper enzyme maturation permease subunit
MKDGAAIPKTLSGFVTVAIKGGIRDRVISAILLVGVLLLLSTPVVAVFSMRQVLALATSYSLAIISLVGLLLTFFLAMSLVARDLEQRSIYTVCSLPISRSSYLLGKFLGFAILILLALAILGCFSAGALAVLERIYPPEKPFAWKGFFLGLWLQYWVFLIVGAITVMFSTVATSSFLPLVLSVGIYFGSYSTEAVRYYVQSGGGQDQLTPAVRMFGQLVYWILPNFSAFNIKTEVVYGLALEGKTLLLTQLYGLGYLGIVLVLAMIAFSHREFL